MKIGRVDVMFATVDHDLAGEIGVVANSHFVTSINKTTCADNGALPDLNISGIIDFDASMKGTSRTELKPD